MFFARVMITVSWISAHSAGDVLDDDTNHFSKKSLTHVSKYVKGSELVVSATGACVHFKIHCTVGLFC